MNKYLLIGVVVILIVAGGWWYLSQQNAPTVSQIHAPVSNQATQVPSTQATQTSSQNSPSTTAKGNFSAYPASGVAPLNVNFTTSVDYAGFKIVNNNVDIDFGDGTIESMNGRCSPSHCSINHMYTESGAYTISLRKSDAPYQEGKTWPPCTATELGCTLVGTVKVTVQ